MSDSMVVPFYGVDAKTLGGISGTKSFGPLSLTYCIDVEAPKVTGSATLYGIHIGGFELSPQHPDITIGGNAGFAKAELDLNVNFDKKEIDYKVDVEAFGHVIVNSSGKLFSW